MTPMTWVAFAASCMSLIIGLIAIYNFGKQKGQAKVEEGKKQEQFAQIRRDLEAAWAEIRCLKTSGTAGEKVLVAIQTTLGHIQESLKRVEEKLDGHLAK